MAGDWVSFDVDLMVPDDVYEGIHAKLHDLGIKALQHVMGEFGKALTDAGLTGIQITKDPGGTGVGKFKVSGHCDPADLGSIRRACDDHGANVDKESLEGSRAKLFLYIPVFKSEYEPYSKAQNDLVEQWLSPYVQQVEDLGMMNVQVRVVGPAGGNPWIGGRAPRSMAKEIEAVLKPIMMDKLRIK